MDSQSVAIPPLPDALQLDAAKYLIPHVIKHSGFFLQVYRDQYATYYQSALPTMGQFILQEERARLGPAISDMAGSLSDGPKERVMKEVLPFVGPDWEGTPIAASPMALDRQFHDILLEFCDYLAGGLAMGRLVRSEAKYCHQNPDKQPTIPPEEAWRWAVYEASTETPGTVLYLTDPTGPTGPTLVRSTTTENGVTLEKVRDIPEGR